MSVALVCADEATAEASRKITPSESEAAFIMVVVSKIILVPEFCRKKI
jgi:hypothetical protein